VPAPTIAKARAALEKAMGRSIDAAAAELERFACRNDAREDAERAAARVTVARQPEAARTSAARTAPTKARAPSTQPANARQTAPRPNDASDKKSRIYRPLRTVMKP